MNNMRITINEQRACINTPTLGKLSTQSDWQLYELATELAICLFASFQKSQVHIAIQSFFNK